MVMNIRPDQKALQEAFLNRRKDDRNRIPPVLDVRHHHIIPQMRNSQRPAEPKQHKFVAKVAESGSSADSGSTILVCDRSRPSYNISRRISVEVQSSTQYGFSPTCPCSYDFYGKCHNGKHMCVASNTDYFCTFKMNEFVISKEGGIFESHTQKQISFSDVTIAGGMKPVYDATSFTNWVKAVDKLKTKYRILPRPPVYDLVVPTRLKWDDCFNHLSFQTVPLISLVYEFHKPLWNEVTWHASLFGAAMINLLNVSMDRIVVEKTILAKTVLLPWIPHWSPMPLASLNGIANKLSAEMARNLIAKQFPSNMSAIEPFNMYLPGVTLEVNQTASMWLKTHKSDPNIRFVVYLSRTQVQLRGVSNESDLLDTIQRALSHNYQLVVLGHSVEYKTIIQLQKSWQRYAEIVNRAIVFMGPHGGGWNNLMFAPSDCHFIEFNFQPNIPVYKEGGAHIRIVFLSAAWAKGGSGKYYIIQPNNNATVYEKPNFYFENKMWVSPQELLQTFQAIDKDVPTLHLWKMNNTDLLIR